VSHTTPKEAIVLLEWTEPGGNPRSATVPRAYALAVARTIADDLGVVLLNGEQITGPATDGDRALYVMWERGGPDGQGLPELEEDGAGGP
jgi:hypothetical protein